MGIMPAAGYATRLGDAVRGSKEVQLVGGRPVMTYLLDRFAAAGASEVRIVTRPAKDDVIALAATHGATVVTGHPATVSASLTLGMVDLAPSDIVLFGFPDTIWSPADGFVPMARTVLDGAPLTLGLFDSDDPARADVAILGDTGRLVRVEVKPGRATTSLVWGAAAARAGYLRDILADAEPGVAFDRAARTGDVATVRLGRVIDIGTPAAIRAADDDPLVRTGPDADRDP